MVVAAAHTTKNEKQTRNLVVSMASFAKLQFHLEHSGTEVRIGIARSHFASNSSAKRIYKGLMEGFALSFQYDN